MEGVIGYIIVLSSTIIYALLPTLLKKSSQSLPLLIIMTISMFSLFLTSFILSLIFEKGSIMKVSTHTSTFALLFTVGMLNALGFYLAIQGYKYMPLWQQSMFAVLIPVLSGMFSYFILGEAINPKLFIGLFIMSIGLFIALK